MKIAIRSIIGIPDKAKIEVFQGPKGIVSHFQLETF
jgi:hypothetical protein